MALNQDYAGRTYAPSSVYEVGSEKIREFATAIGDANPAYHDVAAARALGYPGLVAPPTFVFLVTLAASQAAISDPGLGLDYSRVVHGDQRFGYTRPLVAGDRIRTTATLESAAVGGRQRHGHHPVRGHRRDRRAGGRHLDDARRARYRRRGGPVTPSYDAVAVGDALPPLSAQLRRVDLVRYAGASEDFNPIHWNQRVATSVGLPDVIAHGMLTMATGRADRDRLGR